MTPKGGILCVILAVPLNAQVVEMLAANTSQSASCETAACCKANAKVNADAQLCDDFYNQNVGVGYQMKTVRGWAWLAQSQSGVNKIFSDSPRTTRIGQQCVSITHSGKTACPYPGADAWGFALSVGPGSNFWQYFERCPKGELTAQCHDGWKCGPDRRTPIAAADSTYEQWLREKNAVVAQTGTSACSLSHPSSYNEFDTNGLSSRALAGVFIPECLHRKRVPSSGDVCGALRRIKPDRREPWPVYSYSSSRTTRTSSLRLHSYLNCDATFIV